MFRNHPASAFVLGATLSLSSITVFASAEVPRKAATQQSQSIERFITPGISVTATPFFDSQALDGENATLYNLPSINEDLMLLRGRKDFYETLAKKGLPMPDHAIIGISGALEASATYADFYSAASGGEEGNVNLSAGELDIGVLANQWVTGYFSINYDDSPASTGSREENSRLYLKRGFITIGNLNKSPLYMTAGQMYAPFGLYHSAMLTTPETKSMGRVLERMILVGYDQGTVALSLYGYHSDLAGSNKAPFNQGGVNVLIKKQLSQVSTRFSVGVISNVADSQGMLKNGLAETASDGVTTQYSGFRTLLHSNTLNHGVPGLAVDAIAQWDHWGATAGLVDSLDHFSSGDMTFNGRPAAPGAVHAELNYIWKINSRPFTVALAYGHTWQALALNLPKNSVSVVANTLLWKGVTLGVEYRHSINYKAGTTAQGRVTTSKSGVDDIEVGGHSDGVTAQMSFYF